ncbi:MAG: protein kinase [Myxococcota bacterium]|nr:protein kinase [Myxococcota bacterium]
MDANLEKLIRVLVTRSNHAEQVESLCRELGIDRAMLQDLVELNRSLFDSVHTNKRQSGLASVGLGADGRHAAYDLGILGASPVADAETVRNHLLSVEGGHALVSSENLDLALGLGSARLRDAVHLLERSGRAKGQHVLGGSFHVSLSALGRAEGKAAAPSNRATGSVVLDALASKAASRSPDMEGAMVEDHRFTVGARLGEGTAGEVYRAHDEQLGRPVALKFVTATRAGEDALAHARALARVAHPNIVTVFEVTRLKHPTSAAPSSVVVMELIEGTPLAERIGTSMTREEMLRVSYALVDALDAYHHANLAHLDLHDGNVMVGASTVKVLDPLYYDTDALRSTATRERQQARDVRAVRDVLVQLVYGAEKVGATSIGRANEFLCATGDGTPRLDVLRAELEKALSVEQPALPTRAVTTTTSVSPAREDVLRGTYQRLRQVHKTTLSLINLVQVDGSDEKSNADGEKRRWAEHDSAWRELQEFHLANALYLGARLDGLVNDYMAGIIRAVAGWQAGRQSRGNVYDWSNAFSGLKALGETTLEQITREIRDTLGIRDASSGSESPDSSRGS